MHSDLSITQGQPAPKVTVTTTTTTTATTSITTTVHHTFTVAHHITPSFSPLSTQASLKHNTPNQPTASSFTVTITAPAPTSSQTNLPPPKGGPPVNVSSLSDFPGPKSTPTSDCDVSVNSNDGRPSGSNDIDGSEIGPHIQNGSDVPSGNSHNNSSYSNSTRYDNDNSTPLNGNSSIGHGPVENSNDSNNKGAHDSDENSNNSDIQNEKSHRMGSSDDISRPPMKLCCNSQGQADSLVITLMAHSLGLDLSNKTGIIGNVFTLVFNIILSFKI